MRRVAARALGTALIAVALAGCATTPDPAPGPTTTSPSGALPAPEGEVVGTVVRFTSEETSVDVTIGEDNSTVRDFLSLLPVEVAIEEFAGREKIAYFSRELRSEGSPGSDPEDGDLIYFTPWGNLGFYYNADGIDYSDATIHLGTYSATPDQLALLEGEQVLIEIVSR